MILPRNSLWLCPPEREGANRTFVLLRACTFACAHLYCDEQMGGSSSVIALEQADWELAAVDFHCTNMGQLLSEEGKQVLAECGVEDVSGLIWRNSSGIYTKTALPFGAPPEPTNHRERKLWDTRIQPLFNRLARRILRQRYAQGIQSHASHTT
eukprot:m.65320 g.65320  ORF g.65320 m.65320 type:complete len:154 (+) comp12051_c0_seq4:1981-2442(+)